MSKVIFWDFDGTLVHPNERFIKTFISATESFKIALSYDAVKPFFHSIYPWNSPEIHYPERKGELWWTDFFKKIDLFLTEEKISSENKEKIKNLFKSEMINNNTYILYDDTKDVLKKCLDMGYKNCLLSNNYPELPLILDDFGISEYFSHLFVSANIGYEKPRQELFSFAFKAAGSPEICYMVGDNPIADIEGAKTAGFKTVLVHRGKISNADYEFESLSEIPEILE